MSQSETDINLSPILRTIARGWPAIVLFGAIGALVGFGFSVIKPPKFLAEATLGVTINYGVTQPLELVVEDRALNRFTALILSDSTLEGALARLPQEIRKSRKLDVPSDMRKVIRLEQRLAEWGLMAIDPESTVAAELAQAWADASLEALDDAVAHSWRAIGLMQGTFDVECERVERSNVEATGSVWVCQVAQIELPPDALDGTLQTELELSRGIMPNISYELLQSADPPDRSILRDRGILVIAGAALGTIFGTVLIAIRYPRQTQWTAPH